MNLDTLLVAGILVVEIIDFFRTRWEWKQEYEFDRVIHEKKQRKTKTTKKKSTSPDGTVIEEHTDEVEVTGSEPQNPKP